MKAIAVFGQFHTDPFICKYTDLLFSTNLYGYDLFDTDKWDTIYSITPRGEFNEMFINENSQIANISPGVQISMRFSNERKCVRLLVIF